MKKTSNILLIFILGVAANCGYAQNLVPNPSFEQYSACPTSLGQISYAIPWTQPDATTDYFNPCNSTNCGVPGNDCGWEFAHSGNAYAGIDVYGPFNNYREYLEVGLTDTLTSNIKYCLSFYVSLSDSSSYSVSNIGAYFSSSFLSTSGGQPILASPQILNPSNNLLTSKTMWTQISGCFTANGGEKYLTIGNFFDDTNSDTVFVGNCGNAWCSTVYYFIDDVSVIADTATGINETQNLKFKVYPNPFSISTTFDLPEDENYQLKIFDVAGKLVDTKIFSGKQFVYENESLSKGIYFYEVKSSDKNFARGKIVKE